MSGESSPHEAHDRRIQRLEEALAFAQHENEQLSAEVATLGKRVLALSRKLDALDQKLREDAAKSAEEPNNDPPPHSAPPITRTSP